MSLRCRGILEELGPLLLVRDLGHSRHLEAPVDDLHDWMQLFGASLRLHTQFLLGRRMWGNLHLQTGLVIHLETLLIVVDDFLVAAPAEVVLDQFPAGAELIVELDEPEVLLGRPGSLRANSWVDLVLPSLPALVGAATLEVDGYLLPRTAPLVGFVLKHKLSEPLVFLRSPLLILLDDRFLRRELLVALLAFAGRPAEEYSDHRPILVSTFICIFEQNLVLK